MPKPRKRPSTCFPLRVRNDPALWKYASLQAALTENTATIAALIQAGRKKLTEVRPPIAETTLESVT